MTNFIALRLATAARPQVLLNVALIECVCHKDSEHPGLGTMVHMTAPGEGESASYHVIETLVQIQDCLTKNRIGDYFYP